MTINILKLKGIDFTQYPQERNPALNSNNVQVYCGDCTNDPVKFLHHLVQFGIVETTKKDFKNFSEQIVEQNSLSPSEMKNVVSSFHNFLKKIQVHNNGATLHIIGPLIYEIANGGITIKDYFILKILEKLNNAGQKLNILFNYEAYLFLELHKKVQMKTATKSYTNYQDATPSMLICNYIEHKAISLKTFMTLVEEHFLPHLNLINYTVDEDLSEITIMSPTPINLVIIRNLAYRYDLPFDSSSVQRLIASLDRLILHFQSRLTLPSSSIKAATVQQAYHGGPVSTAEFPIEACITSRVQSEDRLMLDNLRGEQCSVTWLHCQLPNRLTHSNFENSDESPSICLYTEYSDVADQPVVCYIAYSNDEKLSLMLSLIDYVKHTPGHLQNNIFAKMHARFLDISLFGGHRDQQLLDFAKIYEALEEVYNSASVVNREVDMSNALELYFQAHLLKSTGKYMTLRQELEKFRPGDRRDVRLSLTTEFETYKDWIDLLKEKHPATSRPIKHTHSEILHWILNDQLKEKNIVSRIYHV